MSELSAEAKALLASARAEEQPTLADKARIKAKIVAATAAGATTAGAGLLASSAGKSWTLSSKLWLAGVWLAGGAGAVAVVLLAGPMAESPVRHGQRPTPRAITPQNPTPDAPAVDPSEATGFERGRPELDGASPPIADAGRASTEASSVRPAQRRDRARPKLASASTSDRATRSAPNSSRANDGSAVVAVDARDAVAASSRAVDARDAVTTAGEAVAGASVAPSAAPRVPGASALVRETRLVREMRRALLAQSYDGVLRAASEHRRRFPDGVLIEERLAAEIRAACGLGRSKDAARYRAELRGSAPNSPQLVGLPTCDTAR